MKSQNFPIALTNVVGELSYRTNEEIQEMGNRAVFIPWCGTVGLAMSEQLQTDKRSYLFPEENRSCC